MTDCTDHSNAQCPLGEAYRIQENAASVGFDWPDIEGVFEKVLEEFEEVKEAIANAQHDHAKTELGDLIFAIVNLARFLEASPIEELCNANDRFSNRFLLLKTRLQRQGVRIEDCTLDELNLVWEEVKKDGT